MIPLFTKLANKFGTSYKRKQTRSSILERIIRLIVPTVLSFLFLPFFSTFLGGGKLYSRRTCIYPIMPDSIIPRPLLHRTPPVPPPSIDGSLSRALKRGHSSFTREDEGTRFPQTTRQFCYSSVRAAARSPATVGSKTVLLPLENILSNDISWRVGNFTSICSTREICERSGPIFC